MAEAWLKMLNGKNVTQAVSKLLPRQSSSNCASVGKSQTTGVAIFRGGLKKGNSLVFARTL